MTLGYKTKAEIDVLELPDYVMQMYKAALDAIDDAEKIATQAWLNARAQDSDSRGRYVYNKFEKLFSRRSYFEGSLESREKRLADAMMMCNGED